MVKAIKFYADWCGPCKTYSNVWDKVEKELKEEVNFVNVNVDNDTTGLAAQYKVRSIPYTVIVKDGLTETKKVGILTEEELKKLIIN